MARSTMSYLGRSVLFWVGFGLLAGAAVFAAVVYFTAQLQQRYDAEGRTARGLVTNKYTETTRDSDGDRRTTYYVEYSFTTPGGERLGGRDSVSSGTFFELEVEDLVDVMYLESDPTTHRLASSGGWIVVYVFSGVAALLASIALVMLILAYRSAAHFANIGRNGLLRNGRVLDIARTAVRVNGRPRYRMHYEFKGDDGQRYTGKSRHAALDRFAGLDSGDVVDIYVDRNHPSKSVWSKDI